MELNVLCVVVIVMLNYWSSVSSIWFRKPLPDAFRRQMLLFLAADLPVILVLGGCFASGGVLVAISIWSLTARLVFAFALGKDWEEMDKRRARLLEQEKLGVAPQPVWSFLSFAIVATSISGTTPFLVGRGYLHWLRRGGHATGLDLRLSLLTLYLAILGLWILRLIPEAKRRWLPDD